VFCGDSRCGDVVYGLEQERMCSVCCVIGNAVYGRNDGLAGEGRENVFYML